MFPPSLPYNPAVDQPVRPGHCRHTARPTTTPMSRQSRIDASRLPLDRSGSRSRSVTPLREVAPVGGRSSADHDRLSPEFSVRQLDTPPGLREFRDSENLSRSSFDSKPSPFVDRIMKEFEARARAVMQYPAVTLQSARPFTNRRSLSPAARAPHASSPATKSSSGATPGSGAKAVGSGRRERLAPPQPGGKPRRERFRMFPTDGDASGREARPGRRVARSVPLRREPNLSASQSAILGEFGFGDGSSPSDYDDDGVMDDVENVVGGDIASPTSRLIRRLRAAGGSEAVVVRLQTENEALRRRAQGLELEIQRARIDSAESKDGTDAHRRHVDALAFDNARLTARLAELEAQTAQLSREKQELELAQRSSASLGSLEHLLRQALAEKEALYADLAQVGVSTALGWLPWPCCLARSAPASCCMHAVLTLSPRQALATGVWPGDPAAAGVGIRPRC